MLVKQCVPSTLSWRENCKGWPLYVSLMDIYVFFLLRSLELVVAEGSIMLNLTAGSHLVRHYNAFSGFYAIYSRLNLSATANFTKTWETGHRLCLRLWADQTSTSAKIAFE